MTFHPAPLSESASAIEASSESLRDPVESDFDSVPLLLLFRALHAHLEVLVQQLRSISEITYADTSLDPCFGSSIGAHVRHIMDHIRNLSESGEIIDYEARHRGDPIETSRDLALQRIADCQTAIITRMRKFASYGSIRISAIPSPGHTPLTLSSTLERECLYVIDHTVHHLAMIRTLLARAGHACPSTLGLAAGTPTCEPSISNAAPCAR